MSLDSEKGKREKTQNPKPKTQNPPSITAQTVKGALAQGEAGLVELCTRLDIPEADSKGRDQVRKILRDLENFHQIKVDAKKGIWIYRLTDKPGARGAVQAKIDVYPARPSPGNRLIDLLKRFFQVAPRLQGPDAVIGRQAHKVEPQGAYCIEIPFLIRFFPIQGKFFQQIEPAPVW